MRSIKKYAFNGLAGCVVQRVAQQTGTLVGVYHCEQSGYDTDPANPWCSVCEVHGDFVTHPSLRLALSWAPETKGWCEACRNEKRAAS